ncbi:protein cortex [Drosophila grimshawi]|nr:protein cortex [Drosophila grimshawi]
MDILKMNLTQSCSYWSHSSFAFALNNAFNMQEFRLLQFNDMQGQQCFGQRPHGQNTPDDGDWPCHPRTRPIAYPTATNEMPGLWSSFDLNMMDWSKNGQMAISFGENLIISRNEDNISMVFSVENTNSLKYSPSGRYLAIGCMVSQFPVLELWKLLPPNEFLVADGKYLPRSFGSICCIEWSKSNEDILCGTKCGIIVVVELSWMTTEHVLRKHKYQINCMRFSPTGRYLATSDVQGHIFIYDGRNYKVILRLGAKAGGSVFDWHPWSDNELAISEKLPSSIYIFHVQRREIVAFYQRGDEKILIKSLNFSKITGELLVNTYRQDENGCPCTEILVLSSLNRVVDILGYQDRGALFMMWSPDGRSLAAAGHDESFSVWDFYPADKTNAEIIKDFLDKADRSVLELYGPFK